MWLKENRQRNAFALQAQNPETLRCSGQDWLRNSGISEMYCGDTKSEILLKYNQSKDKVNKYSKLTTS